MMFTERGAAKGSESHNLTAEDLGRGTVPNSAYETVKAAARFIQPSYVDGVTPDAKPKASNMLTFSEIFPDDVCAETRAAVLNEYRSMPSYHETRTAFDAATSTLPDKAGRDALADMLVSYYLNAHIYHNAEHMLKMTGDAVSSSIAIAAEEGLDAHATERRGKCLFVAGLYHDDGNGRYPRGELGRDEIDAVRTFLRDRAAAAERPALAYLADLSDDEAIQICADIMATVFLDRHATADMVAARPYIDEVLGHLRQYGLTPTKEDFLKRLESTEALIIRNADVSGSLTPEGLVKNTFTVHFENLLKSPTFAGKGFADSRRGFTGFLAGNFQSAVHGSETALSREARDGNAILNPDNRFVAFEQGNLLAIEIERQFLMTLAYDRQICEACCKVIEENVLSGECNILELPLKDVGEKLSARLGSEEYEPYRSHVERFADRSLSSLSQGEVNSIFQLKTRAALSAIEMGKGDARIEVREVAEAFDYLRPDCWQARYFVALLQYAAQHPDDRFLTARNGIEGEVLVREGDAGLHAYVTLGGLGDLMVKKGDESVAQIVGYNIAGEMAVLKGARTADLVVEGGPMRLLEIDPKVVAQISSAPEFAGILRSATELRLMNGDLVTTIEEKEVEFFLERVFTFNRIIDDPDYAPSLQRAMKKVELEGVAHERKWPIVALPGGEALIIKGEEPEFVYVVTEGNLQVALPDGTASIKCEPGALVGEMSLLRDDHKATATVTAGDTGARVICLPRELLAKCPDAIRMLVAHRKAS